MARAVEAIGRERRRAEIIGEAGRLFAQKGIRETTVRQIAERVGVLSGSLYYHFATKNEIVHELMRGYVEDLLERYREVLGRGGSPRARLERLLEAALECMIERPHENAILARELDRMFLEEEFAYLRESVDEVEELYLGVIREGIAQGEIRSDIEPRFIFRVLMDVAKGAPFWFDPEIHRVPEVVADWWKVIGEGIGAR